MSQIVKPQWLSCANEPFCSASLIFNIRQHIPLKEIITEMLSGGLSFIWHTVGLKSYVWVSVVKGGNFFILKLMINGCEITWDISLDFRFFSDIKYKLVDLREAWNLITDTANQNSEIFFLYLYFLKGLTGPLGLKGDEGPRGLPGDPAKGVRKQCHSHTHTFKLYNTQHSVITTQHFCHLNR